MKEQRNENIKTKIHRTVSDHATPLKDGNEAQQKCRLCGEGTQRQMVLPYPYKGDWLLLCSPTGAIRYCERLQPAKNPDAPQIHQA